MPQLLRYFAVQKKTWLILLSGYLNEDASLDNCNRFVEVEPLVQDERKASVYDSSVSSSSEYSALTVVEARSCWLWEQNISS